MVDYTTNDSNSGLWVLVVGAAIVAVIAILYLASGGTSAPDAGGGVAPAAETTIEPAAPAVAE